MDNITALILAAGSSNRLGEPKQLVKVKGKPLLRSLVDKLQKAEYKKMLVVLGSEFDQIKRTIDISQIEIAINHNWEKGMGESLSFGIKNVLLKWPETQYLLITVCDQPFIPFNHFHQLKKEIQTGNFPIIATGYNKTFGPPIVCTKNYFHELLQLQGEKGAKSIFKNYINNMKVIPCKEGALDIDTPEDLKKIIGIP